jgi:Putative Flp pilus-assembly TadE/G-like
MLNSQHCRRGQTIPFWVFAVITSLLLTIFIVNYTNTVRWHIRAQNAADAAAIATIAGDASLMNQRTIAEYAAAVDEYRLRSIVYSMINAANAVGFSTTQSNFALNTITTTCDPSVLGDDMGTDCDNAYDQQTFYYDTALAQYVLITQQLENLIKPSPPPNVTPAPSASGAATPAPVPAVPSGSMAGAAYSLVQSGQYCWDQPNIGTPTRPGVFDCSFFYNANLANTGPGSSEIVDIVSCRNVVSQAKMLFGGLLSSQFQAVGHAAATLQPIVSQFSPGVATDPATGNVYAPPETCQPTNGTPPGPCNMYEGWMASGSYNVDFGQGLGSQYGLTVKTTFYVPVLTKPLTGAAVASLACEQG